jgi:hypothetical protein
MMEVFGDIEMMSSTEESTPTVGWDIVLVATGLSFRVSMVIGGMTLLRGLRWMLWGTDGLEIRSTVADGMVSG